VRWRTSWQPARVYTACTPADPGRAGSHWLRSEACRVPAAQKLVLVEQSCCESYVAAAAWAVLRSLPRLGTLLNVEHQNMHVHRKHEHYILLVPNHLRITAQQSSDHLGLRGRRWSLTSARQAKHSEWWPSGDDLLRGNMRSGWLSLHRWQHFSPLPAVSDGWLLSC
jgi:hypothetical protein